MADKIVAYVSQHTIRIVVTEQSKVQQVINALMAMAKLFHYEKYYIIRCNLLGEDVRKKKNPIALLRE